MSETDGEDAGLIRRVAALLDYPSVYMGGPSFDAVRKAGRIVAYFRKQGWVPPKTLAESTVVKVDPTIPPDEVHFRIDDKTVGKIRGLSNDGS